MQYLTAPSDNGVGGVSDTYTTETKSYNTSGQLASLGFSGGVTGSIQYNYSATQNNGQITQAVDTISGETISYQYDRLKRLTSASSTPNTGSPTAAWNEAFQYDGFGNLTGKTLNGTAGAIPVNAATNQLANAYYDLNGNMTSGAGATLTYDESNRLTSAAEVSGGIEYYSYSPDNKQVWRQLPNGNAEYTVYGAHGEKLGVFAMVPAVPATWPATYILTPIRSNIYFAGKMIWSDNVPAYQDRLGTNRANGARFYPFGDEITSTSNDREKFATYTRDSYTGLDYANQRYFASTYGRFNTADPYQASGGPKSPASWNRYSYTRGDPVNRIDASGLADCFTDDPTCNPDASDPNLTGPSCLGESFVSVCDMGASTSAPDTSDVDVTSDSSSSTAPSQPNCPPGYVPATTQAQLEAIVSTAESYVGKGLTHANNTHYVHQGGVLSAIDCTGLIAQALAGISYTATNFQAPSSSDQFSTSQIPSVFSTVSSVQVGDIVDFGSHAGIVTGVSSTGQVTSFVGSQTSSGPANVSFSSPGGKYWANKMGQASFYTPCVPGP